MWLPEGMWVNEGEEFRANSRLWVQEGKNCLRCVGAMLILGKLVLDVLGRLEWWVLQGGVGTGKKGETMGIFGLIRRSAKNKQGVVVNILKLWLACRRHIPLRENSLDRETLGELHAVFYF